MPVAIAVSTPLPRARRAPARDRWAGVVRPYGERDVERLRGSVTVNHTLAEMGARRLWDLLHTEDYVNALGALTGNQAVQQVRAGLEAIYLSGLAGGRGRQPRRPDVPRPEPVPGQQRPQVVRRINQALLRADQIEHAEGEARASLVRAHRGRRGGRLRRAAERVRADEGHDRGGRRGRPLRGPALVGEEVRPPGRQGAGPDPAVHPHPRRGPPGRRRHGRAHPAHRPHRRGQRQAADHRRRPARPAVPHRRAHRRRGSSGSGAASSGDRPRPGLRAVRRPDLVRDLHAGPRGGAALRGGHPRAVPRQAARLQLLALVQLEASTWTTPTIARFQQRAGRAWATSSSS